MNRIIVSTSKRKKMKKNVFFKNMMRVLPLCLVFLVAGLTSCNNENERTTSSHELTSLTETSVEGISSFFNSTSLDGISILRDFFPSSYESYSQKDTCFMINSRAELEELYSGEKKLPVINFEDYTLILGMAMAPAGYLIEIHAINITDDAINVTLTMKPLEGAFIAAIVPYYYWGLYEKLPQKDIVVKKM